MEPRRYRKKPVEIDAIRNDSRLNEDYLAAWCGGKVQVGGAITIDTLEGQMRADPGDWIIRGVKGEFYPCKHDIFEASYEAVEPGGVS